MLLPRVIGHRYFPPGAALAASMGVVAVALGIYAPVFAAPWDVYDYADFLPLLVAGSTFGEGFQAVSAFYAGHGRFQPLTHALIALSWSLFGMDAAGWQLLRAILMLACTGAAYILLRRLGATRLAGAAGAALFVAAPSAGASWITLAGEPIATLALLAGAIVASSYQSAARWRIAGLSVAALAAAAVLAKETAVVLVPFVVALAWRGHSLGETAPARLFDRRTIWLVASVGAALVLVGLCILTVAISASGSDASYITSYGEGRFKLSTVSRRLMWMALPFPPSAAATPGQLLRLPPNLIFGGIVLIGGIATIGAPALRRKWAIAVLTAMLLAFAGALVYLPWPRFVSFYGLPFLFGTSFVLAVSLTMAGRMRPLVAGAAYGGYIVVLASLVLLARENVVRAAAGRTVNAAVVTKIREYANRDSVLVANYYRPKQAWQALGATLGRYAFGAGHAAVVTDVGCERTDRVGSEPLLNSVLISYSNLCGTLAQPSQTIRTRFRYRDWRSLTLVEDSIRVDFHAGRTSAAAQSNDEG